MIYHQFTGIVIKRTETKKNDKEITTITAEFPDQVNPEYQYTKEKLTFIDKDNTIRLGDSVRVVVMDVPPVTESEVLKGDYLEPANEGA